MIASLRLELTQIDEAILNLERLAQGGGKRRGRPPKWLAEAKSAPEPAAAAAPRGKKRTLSPEARKRMAEAQKRRWAAARGDGEAV